MCLVSRFSSTSRWTAQAGPCSPRRRASCPPRTGGSSSPWCSSATRGVRTMETISGHSPCPSQILVPCSGLACSLLSGETDLDKENSLSYRKFEQSSALDWVTSKVWSEAVVVVLEEAVQQLGDVVGRLVGEEDVGHFCHLVSLLGVATGAGL